MSSTDDIIRIDQNVNGLFQQVSDLKDRVAELEEENDELRAEIEMLWQAVSDDE